MSDLVYAKAQAQQKTLIGSSPKNSLLQRTCACGQHTIAGGECEECRQKREGMMQRRTVSPAPMSTMPPIVHEVLNSEGQPLDADTRAFMEPRFGYDFSQVRVHTDAHAVESAQAVNAIAYTVGSNVVFASDRYEPSSIQGHALLAHELTHVLQQRVGVQLPEGVGRMGDQYERRADEVAQQIAHGGSSQHLLADYPVMAGGGGGALIQREFESRGYGVQDDTGKGDKITRPEQVLSEYGMTCYGTSVMFMIQSYGLVPPDMTRQEFEYAFTPLNPKNPTSPEDARTDPIEVAGKAQPNARPVDLITEALQGTPRPSKSKTSIGKVTYTEATLRGADKGSYTVAQIMDHMPKILAAFKAQSEKKGYEFMKAHVPVSGQGYIASAAEKWIENSDELIKGTIGADYFKDGNTIMAGVDYNYPPAQHLGHWVVIVKEPEKKEIAGKQHFLYAADDPLWGQAYVMAPLLGKVNDNKDLDDAHLSKEGSTLKYNGLRVHMLLKAFRRKVQKKP